MQTAELLATDFSLKYDVRIFEGRQELRKLSFIELDAAVRKANRHVDTAAAVKMQFDVTAYVIDSNGYLAHWRAWPSERQGNKMNILRDTKLFKTMNGKLLLMVTPSGRMKATITNVKNEKLGAGGEPTTLVYFKEFPQAVSLNKTRALSLMDELGFDTARWKGAKVRLTAAQKSEVAFGKEYNPLFIEVLSTADAPKQAATPKPKAEPVSAEKPVGLHVQYTDLMYANYPDVDAMEAVEAQHAERFGLVAMLDATDEQLQELIAELEGALQAPEQAAMPV